MSITAIVQNDTITLPVHVPDGTRVEIVLPEQTEGVVIDPVAVLVGAFAGPAEATGRNAEEILYGPDK